MDKPTHSWNTVFLLKKPLIYPVVKPLIYLWDSEPIFEIGGRRQIGTEISSTVLWVRQKRVSNLTPNVHQSTVSLPSGKRLHNYGKIHHF